MDDLEFNDPRWEGLKGRLLQDARSDFAPFYRSATLEDAHVMDALVLTRAVLEYAMKSPRAYVAKDIRPGLERLDDKTQQLFAHLRECVRACPTFAGLNATDKAHLEHSLFEVRAEVE